MDTKLRNIPFSPPDMSEQEIAEVAATLRSGWITTGLRKKEFERRIAAYIGVKNVVCLNSATAALEMALLLIGVGPDDEVIVPAYTYTATASVTQHVGCRLVFVDSQKDCVEMDYDKLADAITERTKVVCPVDLGGIVCDYDKVSAIVEAKRSLFRPANEMQRRIGRVVVSADCPSYLPQVPKMEGETWDAFLYRVVQLYSLHGQNKDALTKTKLCSWEYDVIGPWYKCNMTDIMAGIGLAQLSRYQGMLDRRKHIVGVYDRALQDLPVAVLNHYGEDFSGNGHLYITRLLGRTDEERREVIERMADRGIATNVHYKPLPMMTAYKALGFDINDYPNAYHLYENEITLPLHTKLSDEDVEYVITNFVDIVKN